MDKSFGWWVDLTKVTLADVDGQHTTWVHALPVGEYIHPLYGKMNLDTAKLTGLAASVKNKTRGIDPDIDYDHKEDPAKGHQAAGWVHDAEVRDNGLHLLVGFTPTAAAEIREKKYRYFSAEYKDEWSDPTGKVHKDVIFGGGLTNRPYMKNLMPVNLSELTFGNPLDKPKEGETEVDPKKLRESLGLAESASDEDVLKKLGEVGASLTTLTETNTKLTEENTSLKAELAKLKEPDKLDPELKKLIESSPAFAKLYEASQEKDKKLTELQEGIKLAEVTAKLTELQQGKTFALSPATRETAKQIMLKSTAEASKAFFELLSAVVNGTGLVDLSERGYTGRRDRSGDDATRKFNELVEEYQKANKDANVADALEAVARSHPQLFAEYREDSYQFKM